MATLLVVLPLLAFIPSALAARKGHSPIGYWLFGLVLFVPAMIVVLLLPEEPTSVAAMRRRTR